MSALASYHDAAEIHPAPFAVVSEVNPVSGVETLVVRCVLPPGLTVGPNKYGTGLFVTRPFAKGEILYTGSYSVIADDGKDGRPIRLETDVGIFPMSQAVHTVSVGNNQRHLFTFDGFMNHNCEPSTFSADAKDGLLGGTYKTVALRDMQTGEEVTCDYDLFELDSSGKDIDRCECGSASCRGFSKGFLFVPEDQQLAMLSKLDREVMQEYLKIHPRTMYRFLETQAGVAVRSGGGGGSDLELIATRDFSPGDVLFEYNSEYFDAGSFDTLLVNVEVVPSAETPPPPPEGFWTEPERVVVELPFLTHTVNRAATAGVGQREFFSFDSFCNHSCGPNASFDYVEGSRTLGRTTAIREIKKGDTITNDYATFDDELDGTVFECQCGEPNCRKIIRG